MLQEATVCYLIRENAGQTEVCLVEKKRGYGAGFLVGHGGKRETGEFTRESVKRELREEARVFAYPTHLKKIARVDTFSLNPSNRWRVHIFICSKWRGEPKESEETGPPQWFPIERLPFERMFKDARYWLQRVLARQEGETISLFLSPGGGVEAYFPEFAMNLRHRHV